jgi:hypothetical protein
MIRKAGRVEPYSRPQAHLPSKPSLGRL